MSNRFSKFNAYQIAPRLTCLVCEPNLRAAILHPKSILQTPCPLLVVCKDCGTVLFLKMCDTVRYTSCLVQKSEWQWSVFDADGNLNGFVVKPLDRYMRVGLGGHMYTELE